MFPEWPQDIFAAGVGGVLLPSTGQRPGVNFLQQYTSIPTTGKDPTPNVSSVQVKKPSAPLSGRGSGKLPCRRRQCGGGGAARAKAPRQETKAGRRKLKMSGSERSSGEPRQGERG